MKNLAFLSFFVVCNIVPSFGQIKIFIGEPKEKVKDYWSTEISALYFHDDIESEFYIMIGDIGIPEFIAQFNPKGKCVSHCTKISFAEISIIQARLKKDGFVYNNKLEIWTNSIKKVSAKIRQNGNTFLIEFENNSKEYILAKEKDKILNERINKKLDSINAENKRIEEQKLWKGVDTQRADYSLIEAELKKLEQKNEHTNDDTNEEIFAVASEMPEPIEGMAEFYKYISANLKIPLIAKEKGINGKVFLNFVVEKDGSINKIKIIRGIVGCKECEEEAIRVIQAYPKRWKAGKHDGKIVRVSFTTPISFKLVQ